MEDEYGMPVADLDNLAADQVMMERDGGHDYQLHEYTGISIHLFEIRCELYVMNRLSHYIFLEKSCCNSSYKY